MSPAELDPNDQSSKHAQKNICMTFEKTAYHFQMAEKYLVKVIEPNTAAESLDDLRCAIYVTRKTTFSKFGPASLAIKEHLL